MRSPDRDSNKSAMSISSDRSYRSRSRSASRSHSRRSSSTRSLPADAIKNDNIKVIARFRPDLDNGSIVNYMSDRQSVGLGTRDQTFTFDCVFDEGSTQEDIFEYSVRQTTDELSQGYNGTVLCYGQTGAGKSYTVMGNLDDPERKGLIPRIFERIFEIIEESPKTLEYTVGVSYMEIYNEVLKDLLDPTNNGKLTIRENKVDGVYVTHLETFYVATLEDVYTILKQGSKNRTTGATKMNSQSSRSHAIFQIKLSSKDLDSGVVKMGNLFLVDLAGSEKIDKTGASGQLLEEAKKINSSLSALGKVINSLTDGESRHIPYRDSKLTRILQESLGGNSRTTLIINCSPSEYNEQETLSTLRFGSRAKHITNAVHINSELSTNELKKRYLEQLQVNEENNKRLETLEARIRMLEEENSELKDKLGQLSGLDNSITPDELRELLKTGSATSDSSKMEALERALEQFSAQIKQVDSQNGQLKRDIASLKDISDMKAARIAELQHQLNSREALVQVDSRNFENKMEYLKGRFDAVKVPPEEDQDDSQPGSSLAALMADNKENKSRKKQTAKRGRPAAASATTTSQVSSSSSKLPPAVARRMGLNLRIVKPMRGGKEE